MYDIRQFLPTLYLVLLLALAGYGIALESLSHLAGGVCLVALHMVLAHRGSLLLVPRLIASILAVITGLWSLLSLISGAASPLMAISQWLFMLVLITLYSRRDNRAFGQMLVMSLVLMVAGAINTAGLLFGIILIVYLFLALYCCLLFHLKVESESATRAYNLSDNRAEPGSLRHDQRHLNRSMRRLATFVSAVAIACGIFVFLFFPRSRFTPAFAMEPQGRQGASLTGFSERMGFEQIARITQNQEVVAHVSLSEGGQPLPPSEIYLRGTTLDVYTGRSYRSRQLDWQWIRSPATSDIMERYHLTPGEWQPLAVTPGARQVHQTVLLQPIGTSTLFALNGITSITTDTATDVHHFPMDGTLRATASPHVALRYEAISTLEPPPYQAPRPGADYSAQNVPYPIRQFAVVPPSASRIDPRIVEYAARPAVSGADANGPLATQRSSDAAAPTPLDEKIASAICRHLQSDFQYTLDLTDIARRPLQDPIAQFLYDFKRGHCEYFAGAMTLMCQSLGLKARVVIGFRAGPDDYNQVGGYYVIRQSHAHAWVEVLTPQGWKSFDPTTGNPYVSPSPRGTFAALTDIFDYLQYHWLASVVTYDNQSFSLIDYIESGFSSSAQSISGMLQSIQQYLRSEQGARLSVRILIAAIAVLVAGLLLAVTIYLVQRRRLNRRAQRIGLGALPPQERLRLARQLRFYDDLLQLLARRRIARPSHLTPREFAASLSFLPSDIYAKVGQITDVFYRVRYGDQPLATREHRHVASSIADIAASLAANSPRG